MPFPIVGAVKFDNQAQFHSRKYLLHLIKQIPGNGSYVFENTRVLKVAEDNRCQVTTDKGIIQAQDVIVATNIPITDEGLFFAKTYPKRSYIIGARIAEQKAPVGMYIGSGEKYYSIPVLSLPENNNRSETLELLSNQALSFSFLIETKICSQKLKSKAPKRLSGTGFSQSDRTGLFGLLLTRMAYCYLLVAAVIKWE